MVPFFDADDYYSVTNRATVPTEANGVVTTLFRTFSLGARAAENLSH